MDDFEMDDMGFDLFDDTEDDNKTQSQPEVAVNTASTTAPSAVGRRVSFADANADADAEHGSGDGSSAASAGAGAENVAAAGVGGDDADGKDDKDDGDSSAAPSSASKRPTDKAALKLWKAQRKHEEEAKRDAMVQKAMYAARDGRIDELREILNDRRSRVKVKSKLRGRTLLMEAAAGGCLEVAQMLLDGGASVNDKDRHGVSVLMHAARTGNPDLVRLLIDSGAKVDARDKNRWTTAQHASRGGSVECVKMLIEHWINPPLGTLFTKEYIRARQSNWRNLIAAASKSGCAVPEEKRDPSIDDDGFHVLHYLVDVRPVETVTFCIERNYWSPDAVQKTCQAAVMKSASPILLSLKLFEILTQLAKKWNALADELRAVAERFSDVSVELLDSLPTDHLAAWELEEKSGGQNNETDCALAVALRSKNKRFISCARVNRISNFWWQNTWDGFFEEHGFVTGQYPAGDFTVELLNRVVRSPGAAYHISKTKYIIKVVSYLIFLGLLSAVAASRFNVTDAIAPVEIALYVYVLGLFLEEVHQWAHYKTTWKYVVSNVLDIIVISSLVVSFFCRWLLSSSPEPTLDFSTPVESVYIVSLALSVVTVWIRALFVLRHLDTIGPLIALLVILKNMIRDIQHFIVLLFITTAGFFFAFRVVLGETDVSGFETVGNSILTLYTSSLSSDMDLSSFDPLATNRQTIVQVLVCIYLSISAIVLINLLIAMMAYTFVEVKEESDKQYLFTRVSTIWKYDSDPSRNLLAPPLNIIVLTFYWMWKLYNATRNCCQRRKLSGQPQLKSDYDWYCMRCSAYVADVVDEMNKPGSSPDVKDSTKSAFESLNICLTFRITDKAVQEKTLAWLSENMGRYICPNCLRYKCVMSPKILARYRISLVLYRIFWWAPISILSLPLLFSSWLSGRCRKYRRKIDKRLARRKRARLVRSQTRIAGSESTQGLTSGNSTSILSAEPSSASLGTDDGYDSDAFDDELDTLTQGLKHGGLVPDKLFFDADRIKKRFALRPEVVLRVEKLEDRIDLLMTQINRVSEHFGIPLVEEEHRAAREEAEREQLEAAAAVAEARKAKRRQQNGDSTSSLVTDATSLTSTVTADGLDGASSASLVSTLTEVDEKKEA